MTTDSGGLTGLLDDWTAIDSLVPPCGLQGNWHIGIGLGLAPFVDVTTHFQAELVGFSSR